VAGLRVDISLSAVFKILGGDQSRRRQTIDAFRSHYSAPALYVCDRYRLPARQLTGAEKVAVPMGGYQCRL
jgi:hypothetical protein